MISRTHGAVKVDKVIGSVIRFDKRYSEYLTVSTILTNRRNSYGLAMTYNLYKSSFTALYLTTITNFESVTFFKSEFVLTSCIAIKIRAKQRNTDYSWRCASFHDLLVSLMRKNRRNSRCPFINFVTLPKGYFITYLMHKRFCNFKALLMY